MKAVKGKSFHTFGEMQCAESQQKALGMCGLGGGVSQHLKWVGISNVGPKLLSVSQNNMGIRERKEGATQVLEQVSMKGHFGLKKGRMVAQNQSPRQGICVGQSPKCHREQAEWPTMKNATDIQRVKSTGLSVEKTKSTEKYSLVSLQESEDIAEEENEHQEKCSTHMSEQKKEKKQAVVLGKRGGQDFKRSKREPNWRKWKIYHDLGSGIDIR